MKVGLKNIAGKVFLSLVIVIVTLFLAEFGLRIAKPYPVFKTKLPEEVVKAEGLEELAYSYASEWECPPKVKLDWFKKDPAILEAEELSPDITLPASYNPDPANFQDFEVEVVKQWNYFYLLENFCTRKSEFIMDVFWAFPGYAFYFVPPDSCPYPRFRYFPNHHRPKRLGVYNQYGFRGPQIELNKPANTIRLAFVGASTTEQSDFIRFSYPERVVFWLNKWAGESNLEVRFEVLNGGRAGFATEDISAVVHSELLPLKPDFTIFYEGANEFAAEAVVANNWEYEYTEDLAPIKKKLAHNSAIFKQLFYAMDIRVSEPQKPAYEMEWETPNMWETNPQEPGLPFNLNEVSYHLGNIKADMDSIGGDLIISSFVRMVTEDMKLCPPKHDYIYSLNRLYWPLSYADLSKLSDYQNEVFEEIATQLEVPFIDVDKRYPKDPDLFLDFVHMHDSGVRLHAWLTFLELLPLVEEKISKGLLPKSLRLDTLDVHPAFVDNHLIKKVKLECDCEPSTNPESIPCLLDPIFL